MRHHTVIRNRYSPSPRSYSRNMRPVLARRKRPGDRPSFSSRAVRDELIRSYVVKLYDAETDAVYASVYDPQIYQKALDRAKMYCHRLRSRGYRMRYQPRPNPWDGTDVIIRYKGTYWGTYDMDSGAWLMGPRQVPKKKIKKIIAKKNNEATSLYTRVYRQLGVC